MSWKIEVKVRRKRYAILSPLSKEMGGLNRSVKLSQVIFSMVTQIVFFLLVLAYFP